MKKERVFWGVFFILGAVAMVVSKLGLIGDIGIWTILFTVFLAAALIKSVIHRSVSGILFSIAFLCILYAKPLGITALTPWTVLGAALLGSIGCSILFRPWRKKYWVEHHHWGHDHYDEDFDLETIEGDSMTMSTSFAGSIKYVNSNDFKRANLSCSFGSMKVYFDNAVIQGDQAVIVLDVSFAGVELFVPKEWHVENQADMSFGGLEEKNRSQSSGTPVLKLVGECSFSGVTIVYV